MASQAGSYAALLAGGVALTVAISGNTFREVLAGKDSPIRGLISTPPEPAGSTGTTSTAADVQSAGAAASGAASSILSWAKSKLGTSGDSEVVAHWDRLAGAAPGIPWCSAFVNAAMAQAGLKGPSDAAYSGSWLNWSGGTNLHSTNITDAKPGDLLIYNFGDTSMDSHVAIYLGGGKQIQGNDSNNSVGTSGVLSGLVGIVEPHYKASTVLHVDGGAPRVEGA